MKNKLIKILSVIVIALLINAIFMLVAIMSCFMIEFLPLWEVIILSIIALFEAYLFVSAIDKRRKAEWKNLLKKL